MKNTGTTNLLKSYLADNFHDTKFSMLDLKLFAKNKGIPAKSIKSSLGFLTKQRLINNCGQLLNPNGGGLISVYFISDVNKLISSCPKKKTELEFDKQSKFQIMIDAANRLDNALQSLK